MAPHSSAVKLASRAAPPPGMTGAHRWSHAIAKGPPRKIRIVHVVEPTVIKTDPRQFRELVQRLTGKPPNGGAVGFGVGASSSSSSAAESASADSSSRAASGSSSDPDRAVVAPASAVKAEMKEEEEMAASPEVEGFAGAFGEALGETSHGATMATVKAEMDEEEEEEDAASPEEEGFAAAFGEVDETYDAFFNGLDDFLLGAFQADGFSI